MWRVIVGIVGTVHHDGLDVAPRGTLYLPLAQRPTASAFAVVHADGDALALLPPIRAAVAAVDPALPIYDVRPLTDYRLSASGAQRFTMILAAAFAAAALLLACLGLYGLIAYSVSQRRSEFGVRLAVGALPRQVRALVVGEAVRLAALGLALGMPAAILGARLLRSQLFGVTPHDPASYVVALVLLALSAVGAAWIAARHAAAASPFESLRTE
jgi:putative ABC transport system permease protein